MEAVVRHLALLEAQGKGTVGGDSSNPSQSPSSGQLEANFQAIPGPASHYRWFDNG